MPSVIRVPSTVASAEPYTATATASLPRRSVLRKPAAMPALAGSTSSRAWPSTRPADRPMPAPVISIGAASTRTVTEGESRVRAMSPTTRQTRLARIRVSAETPRVTSLAASIGMASTGAVSSSISTPTAPVSRPVTAVR